MNSGVFLLLGTNLGDKRANLLNAQQYISSQVGPIVTGSSLYKTSAWGNTQQPGFYNQVIKIAPMLSPEVALQTLLEIEANMGRVRTEKWGERVIDLDILFWNDQIINTPQLSIPHPGIPNRRFTLIPLAEIAPGFIHPVNQKTIAEMLQECTDILAVERI